MCQILLLLPKIKGRRYPPQTGAMQEAPKIAYKYYRKHEKNKCMVDIVGNPCLHTVVYKETS